MEESSNIDFGNVTNLARVYEGEIKVNQVIISDSLFLILQIYVSSPIQAAAASTGVFTNWLNMMVQCRLGLNSSTSIGVFALSLTDFFVTLLDLAVIVCFLLTKAFTVEIQVDIYGLGQYILAWFRYPGFFISSWIVTVMSAEKCLAVVAPLHVKQVFTRNRTLCVIIIIYVAFLSVVFTIYSSIYMEWQVMKMHDPNGSVVENSKLMVVVSKNSAILEKIIDISFALVLSVMSHAILFVCTAMMVHQLKLSSQIRHRKEPLPKYPHRKTLESSLLTSKEKRMVRVVTSLSVMLLACNVPRYFNIVVYCAFPEFITGTTANLSWLLWGINDVFIMLNCSSHFFVYWLLNVKFRNTCKQMFRDYCFSNCPIHVRVSRLLHFSP